VPFWLLLFGIIAAYWWLPSRRSRMIAIGLLIVAWSTIGCQRRPDTRLAQHPLQLLELAADRWLAYRDVAKLADMGRDLRGRGVARGST
jgi:hypothetical protein